MYMYSKCKVIKCTHVYALCTSYIIKAYCLWLMDTEQPHNDGETPYANQQISKSMQAMPGAHVRKIARGQLCCASASAISLHLHHEAMSTFCTRGNEHSLGLGTTNHFNSFMAHKVLAAQLADAYVGSALDQ